MRRVVAQDGEPVAARDEALVDEAPVRGRRRGYGSGGYGPREGALVLSRIVQLITAVVVFVILLAIALILLDANASNSIVSTIHDAGSSLVGPFKDIFSNKDPKVSVAENWGIAALVYLVVGTFIASLIARVAAPRDRI